MEPVIALSWLHLLLLPIDIERKQNTRIISFKITFAYFVMGKKSRV